MEDADENSSESNVRITGIIYLEKKSAYIQ